MKTCSKCGKDIPNRVVIDGKVRRLSKRSYCLECSPFGHNNRKQIEHYIVVDGVEVKLCSKCKRYLPTGDFYKDGTGSRGVCKSCYYHKHSERKISAIRNHGGKCIKCGYGRNWTALEFHHRDSEAKDNLISELLKRNCSADRLSEELAKCDLLCVVCHRELHNPRCKLSRESYL